MAVREVRRGLSGGNVLGSAVVPRCRRGLPDAVADGSRHRAAQGVEDGPLRHGAEVLEPPRSHAVERASRVAGSSPRIRAATSSMLIARSGRLQSLAMRKRAAAASSGQSRIASAARQPTLPQPSVLSP